MAIEISGCGAITITGAHINLYRLLVLKKAMQVNIETGMNLTRINPFQVVRKEFGITERRKQDVYDTFCSILSANGIA